MAELFMTKDKGIRRGDDDNFNDGGDRIGLWHRFQDAIDSLFEGAARRIVASMPRQVSGIDIPLKSQRGDRSVRTYRGFVGHYFIGDKGHYELIRKALRAAGLDDDCHYFETTPSRIERIKVFKNSYDGILN